MDACVDILLPRLQPLEGLHRVRRDFEWGGVLHPQEPETHRWGRAVELRKYKDSDFPAFLSQHLPADLFPEGFVYFSLVGEGLDWLAREVNQRADDENPVDWGGHPLEALLFEQFSRSSSWAMTFLPHCDTLDFSRETTPGGVVALLKAQLDGSKTPQGFIAWGRTLRP